MRDPHDPEVKIFRFYDDFLGPEDADSDEAGAHGLDKPPLLPRGWAGSGSEVREHPLRPSRGAHLALAAALVTAGSVLAGMGLSGTAPHRAVEPTGGLVQSGTAEAPQATQATAPPGVSTAPDELTAGLPFAEPKTLTVPAIGVHAPVIDTGQTADGTPDIPPMAHPEEVGWYTSTVAPGERGAAVMWGHLDTKNGKAVFEHLSSLKPGATVQVARADKRVATFTVERSAVYQREAVPADALYDDPGYPALRLVTCAGRFDEANQEYTSNIVVFARLSSVTAPMRAVPAPDATPSSSAAKPLHSAHTTKGDREPGAAPMPVPAAEPVPAPMPVPTAEPRPTGSALGAPKPAAPAAVPVPASPKPQAQPQPSSVPQEPATPSGPASGKPGTGVAPKPAASPDSPAPASPSTH